MEKISNVIIRRNHTHTTIINYRVFEQLIFVINIKLYVKVSKKIHLDNNNFLRVPNLNLLPELYYFQFLKKRLQCSVLSNSDDAFTHLYE